ncbi:uncharacterized protein [Henckelia pumila]|uniref:uncharacterized protein n=1 Tax=Henckelia pumila TaxID=405737 RepID=UPI003C6E6DAE
MAQALVITALKLRPYFLSHLVTVLTNSLLRRVMTHPDASGRLVKWTVELGEYDIEYQPRKAIKAQALSDFLTEVATFGQEEVWRVFVNGASSIGGSGVGVILVLPNHEKIKIAVKLDFQASNNDAEYEVVIAGMKQAREVGASHIIIYSDSQLVVQQIPQEENMESDSLAKRAVAGEKDDMESLVQRELVAAIEALEPVFREDTWMSLIVKYLTRGIFQQTKDEPGGSYQGPLLKCLREEEIEYVLREVHEGCCGNHGWSMSMARRVEAEPLAKIIEGEVMKFLWKNIVCRFGLPRKLVSDDGRQFQGQKLEDWCAAMGLRQTFTSVAYPQSNGQTEAYRTTPHTAMQESPFSLVYGSEDILPVEIGQTSARVMAYEDTEEGARAQELDLIEERRKGAARRMEVYRARVMRAYN